MTEAWPFLIQASPALLSALEAADEFCQYLTKDTVLTVQIGDRHGLKMNDLLNEIKRSYLACAAKSCKEIRLDLGFDHYWTFHQYAGRVVTFGELIQRTELVVSDTHSQELNYLIQKNSESDD